MKHHRYYHRYHALYPLNIWVNKWFKDFKKLIHFFSFSIGFDLILKEWKRIGEEDQLKPK